MLLHLKLKMKAMLEKLNAKNGKKGPNAINRIRLNCCLLCMHWKCVCLPYVIILLNRVHFNHFIWTDFFLLWVTFMFVSTVWFSFLFLRLLFVRRHQYLIFNKLFRFYISLFASSLWIKSREEEKENGTNTQNDAIKWHLICCHNHKKLTTGKFLFNFQIGWKKNSYQANDCIVIAISFHATQFGLYLFNHRKFANTHQNLFAFNSRSVIKNANSFFISHKFFASVESFNSKVNKKKVEIVFFLYFEIFFNLWNIQFAWNNTLK